MENKNLIGRKVKINLENKERIGIIDFFEKDQNSYRIHIDGYTTSANVVRIHLNQIEDYILHCNSTSDKVNPEKYVKRFPSGAVRSDSRGKTRFDFLSPYALELVAKHHTKNSDDFNNEDEFGANYFKGIKPRDIEPSLLRHINDLRIAILEKDPKNIKEELTAVASNALMALHQIVLEEKHLYKEIYDNIEYIKV